MFSQTLPKVSKQLIVILLFISFYVGLNIVGLVMGSFNGNLKTKEDYINYVNPVGMLNMYNKWFIESYYQYQSGSSLIQRNSFFGMAMSGLGIGVMFLMCLFIFQLPLSAFFGMMGLNTADSMMTQVLIRLLILFASLILFYGIGGFDAFETILAGMFPGVFKASMDITVQNITVITTK